MELGKPGEVSGDDMREFISDLEELEASLTVEERSGVRRDDKAEYELHTTKASEWNSRALGPPVLSWPEVVLASLQQPRLKIRGSMVRVTTNEFVLFRFGWFWGVRRDMWNIVENRKGEVRR